MAGVRLATWNVNSLKARLGRVEQWLADVQPDVVCMQETKLADSAFPTMAFSALGYESAHHGEGRWNGVAILSRVGLDEVAFGFADTADADPEARLMWATCGDTRVGTLYVPNGRAVGHEVYHHKLDWLGRLRAHLDGACDPGLPIVLCGDFNIAPNDVDVWDPAAFEGATHVSEAEREALARLEEWGLHDVFRTLRPEPGLFSWWDYRAGNFHKRLGMRIDLVMASQPLVEGARFAIIDRNARKGRQPSDHAPVIVDFEAA